MCEAHGKGAEEETTPRPDMSLHQELLENSIRFSELHRGPVRRERGLIHLDSAERDFACTIVERFPERPLAASIETVRVLPSAEEGAKERLLREGFLRRGHLRFLRLTHWSPPVLAEAQNGALCVRPARDLSELTCFSETQTRGFLLPNESFADWFSMLDSANRRNFADGAQRFYVGWHEERAACVTHALVTGHVTGLYAITTLMAFRKRGFMRRVMDAAIAEAAARERIVTLQVYGGTTAEAIYLALGFSVAFDASVWTRAP
jgi:hypothetical protein